MRVLSRSLLAAVIAYGGVAPGAAASPYIHAHRGGALVEGVATYGENGMAAFRHSAAEGYVLELDVKLSSDGVPVVMHDDTLDRTTDCSGTVHSKTAAQLAACRIDILGTTGNMIALAPGDPRREPIPTLAGFLAFAKNAGASINLEIKNLPTDSDFDPTDGYATTIVNAIIASGFPPSRLIVQSFWPANLTVSENLLPEADTSLLTLAAANDGAPAFADSQGFEWTSPEWPANPDHIPDAHGLGLRTVPYTLDTEADVADAFNAGVDALITNDPAMARRVIAAEAGPRPAIPPAPSKADCVAARASVTVPPVTSFAPRPGAPRVFAMQPRQELRHVETYADFRTKIECMIREQVVPRMVSGRPNVVAFNEDIGLMTIATGSRGAAARQAFGDPNAPGCEQQGAPCGAVAALGAVTTAYSAQVTLYNARFPNSTPVSAGFVAATDTFARGWMQTFSDMARRYGVYILGSNNQAPFRDSRDPSEIPAFADPDLPATPDEVYVAIGPEVYNEAFMWGPDDVRQEGPLPLRNVVAQNKKVPLTPIEDQLQLSNGPSTGPDAIENVRPYTLPGTRARMSFATSLPAFIYGYQLGGTPTVDPCSDVAANYMACLDRLGTNLVMQDEANAGRWAGDSGELNYQPLEWMRSTWRTAADPSVGFAYNVTPHMVGNLADLAFDGQTAITQRGLRGPTRCTYVGSSTFVPASPESDPAYLRPYSGPKREFLGIAPWVVPDGPRAGLRKVSAKLAPGSGDPLENQYVEAAVIADLPFPAVAKRGSCGLPRKAARCSVLQRGTARADSLAGTALGDRLLGGRGDDRIRAGRGRDCALGQAGADLIRGGPGADRLRGGKGNDKLIGGPGADRLSGGAGRDRLMAGLGRDLVRARDGRADFVDCGPGRDHAVLDRIDRSRRCERERV